MVRLVLFFVAVCSVSQARTVYRQCHLFYEQSSKVSTSVFTNDFSTERTAVEYLLKFSIRSDNVTYSLAQDLLALKKEDVIVDFGSGEGIALSGFHQDLQTAIQLTDARAQSGRLKFDQHGSFSSFKKVLSEDGVKLSDPDHQAIVEFLSKPLNERPRALGITYKMRPAMHSDRLRFETDRLFEDIPLEEIPEYQVGMAYYGIPSYTKHLSETLYKMLSRLKVGGRLYIYGMDAVVTEPGKVASVIDRYESSLQGKIEGTSMDHWLRSNAKGIKVHSSMGKNWGVIVLERTQNFIEIPRLQLEGRAGEGQQPPNYLFSAI